MSDMAIYRHLLSKAENPTDKFCQFRLLHRLSVSGEVYEALRNSNRAMPAAA